MAVATGMQFVENFPERTYKSMLIPLMQEEKRAGKDHLLCSVYLVSDTFLGDPCVKFKFKNELLRCFATE